MEDHYKDIERFKIAPKWENARPIYKKLSDEFHILTDPFKLKLDADIMSMLDHLIIAIDEVDKIVDELPTEQQRNDITKSMLVYLKNDQPEWKNLLTTESLVEKIEGIKTIVNHLGITERFTDAVSNIFNYTELKRHTLDEKKLIDLVMQEGNMTAELPLSIMKIDSKHAFGKFFSKLCMLMGIADLIVDARNDYKLNYISIKPRISLYFKLNYILITEGIKLLWSFPRKIKFLWYCIKCSWLLITSNEDK